MVLAAQLTLPRTVQVAENLPSAPRVLADLLELLKDPNNGIEEVTVLLRRDVGLTTRVLRIANSIVYTNGDPAGSLEEGLGRIGFVEVGRVAGLAALAALANFRPKFYPMPATRMLENSLLVALLMEELAPQVNIDARTAYTSGLLRSVGKIVLDVTAQRDLGDVASPELGDTPLLAWERGFFGPHNLEVAAAVLRAWRFSIEVIVPIRDHTLHRLAVDPVPAARSDPMAGATVMLHLAAALADARGLGVPGEKIYWDGSVARLERELRLDRAELKQTADRAYARFEKMRAALG